MAPIFGEPVAPAPDEESVITDEPEESACAVSPVPIAAPAKTVFSRNFRPLGD
jgi:hypothetical protein